MLLGRIAKSFPLQRQTEGRVVLRSISVGELKKGVTFVGHHARTAPGIDRVDVDADGDLYVNVPIQGASTTSSHRQPSDSQLC